MNCGYRFLRAVICVGMLVPLLQGASCSDMAEELPGGYQFVSESSNDQFILAPAHMRPEEIPCNVVGHDYDEHFIVARQVASFECFPPQTPGDPSSKHKNPFNQRDGDTYYWVIEVDKHVIHGPYGLDQFEQQRKALKVSDKLNVDRTR